MKILFVCMGNSCRSIMAEGYLKKRLKELGKEDIEVFSGGLLSLTGMQATKEAKQLISEEGGDISEHYAKKVTELDVRSADLILVMEKQHKKYIISRYPYAAKKTYLLKDYKRPMELKTSNDHDIPDPIGKGIDFYREVYLIIKNSVERVLKNT